MLFCSSMEVMPVRFTAPNTKTAHKNAGHSAEEWVAAIVKAGSWRANRRSLPVLWLVIVSAFVFPMGLWSSMDAAGLADEIRQDEKHSGNGASSESIDAGVTTAAKAEAVSEAPNQIEPGEVNRKSVLPNLPDPDLASATSTAAESQESNRCRVQVIVSGRTFTFHVDRGTTVRGAIEACNLQLNEHDRVFPTPDTAVYHGQKIRITRVRVENKTRTVAVQPQVRYQLTTSLQPGKSKVVQWGSSGKVQVSERIWFKDGKVTLRENLGRKAIAGTKDKIIALGAYAQYMPGKIPYHNRYARAYGLAARSGSPRDRIIAHETKAFRAIKSINLSSSGYTNDPRENGGYTTTATGLPVGYGAAAVDPRVIPLGTKLFVEGYGYAFACDVGGAIKGNRIDLAFNSRREAYAHGRRRVRAWILAP